MRTRTAHLERAESILLSLENRRLLNADSAALLFAMRRSSGAPLAASASESGAQAEQTIAEFQRALELAQTGGNLLGRGTLEEARRHLDRAADIIVELVASAPAPVPAEWLMTLADIHTDTAAICRHLGRLTTARDHHREALRLRNSLRSQLPAVETITGLAFDRMELAETLSLEGKWNQAEAQYHEARLDLQSLRAADGPLPGGVAVELLGVVTYKLAELARKTLIPFEASRWANQSALIRREQARLEPSKERWNRYYADSLTLLGEVYLDQTRWEEARHCFETSARIWHNLANWKKSAAYREQVVRVQILRAATLHALGRTGEALDALEVAEPHARALTAFARSAASSDPADTARIAALRKEAAWNRLLADLRYQEGVCLFQLQPSEAETCLREALALYETYRNRRGLARVNTALGDAAMARSDFLAARACYRRSVDILREGGGQPAIQIALAEALRKLAACSLVPGGGSVPGQDGDALAWARQAVELLRPLAVRAPSPSVLAALRDAVLIQGNLLRGEEGDAWERVHAFALAADLAARIAAHQPDLPANREAMDAAHRGLVEAGEALESEDPALGGWAAATIAARISRDSEKRGAGSDEEKGSSP
ncbi:MAG TPA: tetratricopeptide repeat protein [Verrucomicrobiales bacterium]|nr:tetratricopeptide repeat protein [Verrucomicrobiales bacterium]